MRKREFFSVWVVEKRYASSFCQGAVFATCSIQADGGCARSRLLFTNMYLGCDFFEPRGEKRIDIRRFFGYVCPFVKVWVRINFGWVSLFTKNYVTCDFFGHTRI